ncbi:MAG: grhR [Microbacterium sp.]|jgi:DNA-binding MarR family transcriptional regulator|nr:grhR [Microbacterium sp.]
MSGREQPAWTSPSDADLLENIGTAFSRLRRRTTGVPLDMQVARTDVRRDLLLAMVEEADGSLSVNALAAALGMERTSVSRLAASCVSEGLLERVASQSDGRSITLRLTPQGREVLAGARHQQRRAFEYITRQWDDDERLEFARLLHKYVASASREAPE